MLQGFKVLQQRRDIDLDDPDAPPNYLRLQARAKAQNNSAPTQLAVLKEYLTANQELKPLDHICMCIGMVIVAGRPTRLHIGCRCCLMTNGM